IPLGKRDLLGHRRVRCAVVVLLGLGTEWIYHNDTTNTTSDRRMRRMRFDHFLSRSCPKSRVDFYTPKCKFDRENTNDFQNVRVTRRGIVGQTAHVVILSQNYFAREITRFSRTKTWRNYQMLSQNSDREVIALDGVRSCALYELLGKSLCP